MTSNWLFFYYSKEADDMKKMLVVLVLVLSIAYLVMAVGTTRSMEIEYIEVVARPGDTAWTLCRRANDASVDVRKAVWYFKQLNGTTDIRAWDTVQVPVL
jgi:hypothetical protein